MNLINWMTVSGQINAPAGIQNSNYHSLVNRKIVEQKVQKSLRDYICAFKSQKTRQVFKLLKYPRPLYNVQISASKRMPTLSVSNYLGLIDVHLIKKLELSPKSVIINCAIQESVNALILALKEIVQAKALALSADAVIAFKIELSKIQQKKQADGSFEVFILINGIGDAVQTKSKFD